MSTGARALYSSLFFFLMMLRPPRSTLFPYTTLFRSPVGCGECIGLNGERWRSIITIPRRGSAVGGATEPDIGDRKSTRLNSSHRCISYAVFCLKKKKKTTHAPYHLSS